MPDDEDRLDAIIHRECEAHIRSRAMVHLEAAISSMLDGHSIEETAAVLREQAAHLEEMG